MKKKKKEEKLRYLEQLFPEPHRRSVHHGENLSNRNSPIQESEWQDYAWAGGLWTETTSVARRAKKSKRRQPEIEYLKGEQSSEEQREIRERWPFAAADSELRREPREKDREIWELERERKRKIIWWSSWIGP